jgi:hypothetical protein
VGKWVFDMKGPPPGKPIGGIPAFVNGKNSFFEADLTPGEYGMICFVPDAKDGKPHVQHRDGDAVQGELNRVVCAQQPVTENK